MVDVKVPALTEGWFDSRGDAEGLEDLELMGIDNVDRLYARALARSKEYDLNNPILDVTPSSTDIISSSAPTDEPFTFQRHIQLQPDYERLQPLSTTSLSSSRPSLLTSLLNSLPIPAHSTQFLPSIEDLPIPLASLPPELLDPIFLHMDVRSIETFAQTCWRARYLTSHSALWKRLTHYIYKPPFITPPTFSIPNTLKRYNNEYRTFLIEEPRIRFDGCYISLCHYIRPGAGDQWVTVTHMITYHRFLRFYPDGGVISFLTTEMPGEVVPVLRMSLRGKGLHFGRWRLDRGEEGQEADLPVVTEKKGKGKGRGRIVISDLMEPGVQPKYEFEMELSLRQTGRGRYVVPASSVIRYVSC
jgi:F-box protein 9